MYGAFQTPAKQYAAEVRRWRQDLGRMAWAAVQDWMCEPHILAATGKTIAAHQRLTLRSFLALRELAPDIPWLPILQGWEPGDYLRHCEMYARSGVALDRVPLVGVGTICRRQGTRAAVDILGAIAAQGVAVHAFGFKTQGLSLARVASADSMAWSYHARKNAGRTGCTLQHKSCSNCFDFAMRWRAALLRKTKKTPAYCAPA